jgi:hypothetical protein
MILPYLLFSLASFAVLTAFMVYILLRPYVTVDPTVSVLLTAGCALVAGKSIPLYLDMSTPLSGMILHESVTSPSPPHFTDFLSEMLISTRALFIVSLRSFMEPGGTAVRFPVGERNFSLLHVVQTDSEAHPS